MPKKTSIRMTSPPTAKPEQKAEEPQKKRGGYRPRKNAVWGPEEIRQAAALIERHITVMRTMADDLEKIGAKKEKLYIGNLMYADDVLKQWIAQQLIPLVSKAAFASGVEAAIRIIDDK